MVEIDVLPGRAIINTQMRNPLHDNKSKSSLDGASDRVTFLILLINQKFMIDNRQQENRKRLLHPGHEAGQEKDDWFPAEVEQASGFEEEPIARPKAPLSDVPAEKLAGFLTRAEQLLQVPVTTDREDSKEGRDCNINTVELLQEDCKYIASPEIAWWVDQSTLR